MEASSQTIREPSLKHSDVDSLNEVGRVNVASIEVLLRFRDKLDYFLKPHPKTDEKDNRGPSDIHTNLQVLCSQTLDINNLIQQCENRFDQILHGNPKQVTARG